MDNLQKLYQMCIEKDERIAQLERQLETALKMLAGVCLGCDDYQNPGACVDCIREEVEQVN
jgi:hypothetical protein